MKEKSEKDNELVEIKNNNDEVNVKQEVKEQPKMSFSERARSVVNSITLEPYLLAYIVPMAIGDIAVDQLNMMKACRVDLGYNETVCTAVTEGNAFDNITIEAQQASSTALAEMTAWQLPLQNSMPAIFILFLGAWSDRTGNRKVLMLMPLLGRIITVCGLMLATYYFMEWPLWATALIEAIPNMLFGGFSIAIMGSFSYIADVTSVEARTFRIGVVVVIVTLGLPFGSSFSGILLKTVGYYGVYSIQLVGHTLGFVYTYLKIKNVRNEENEGTFIQKVMSFFNPINIWETVSLVIVTPPKQRKRVILVICAFILIRGPSQGEESVTNPYLARRYGFSSVEKSLFLTYNTLMGTAGTTVAIAVFSKYLKMHDSFIGIIGTASKTISSIVYGFAPNRQWLLSGPAFDFFANSAVTATRSIGTKVVDPDKVGKMISLIGFADSLLPVWNTPIYAKTYAATSESFPGAIYFLGSIMTVPAFFVLVTLYILSKRDARDAVKDPAEKEKHAHDNQITTL